MEISLVAVCIVGEFEIVSLYFIIVGPVEVHVIGVLAVHRVDRVVDQAQAVHLPCPDPVAMDVVQGRSFDGQVAAVPQVDAATGEAVACGVQHDVADGPVRSEEHTSELQSLMRTSYTVFCWKKKYV